MTSTIDSADTQLIQYVNGPDTQWEFIKTAGSGSVLDATLSEASGPASIVFNFTGTRVQVVGSILPGLTQTEPPVSIYTLDGGTPVSFDVTDLQNANSAVQQDDITFYTSPLLNYVRHMLIINVSVASTESPYALDYILFTQGSTGVIANSSSSLTSAVSSGQTSSTWPTSSPPANTSSTWTPTLTPTTSNNDPSWHSSSSPPAGVIAGGVVGGVAVVAIALLVALYFWHKRGQRNQYNYRQGHVEDLSPTQMSFSPSPSGVVPYPITAAGSPPVTPGGRENADLIIPMGKNTSSNYLTYNAPRAAHASSSALGSVVLGPQDSVSQVGDASGGRRANLAAEKWQAAQTLADSAEGSSASGSSGAGRLLPPPPSLPPLSLSPTPEMRNLDSGLRFPQATPSDLAPLDAPPEYTPN